jgi:hypothetical protein
MEGTKMNELLKKAWWTEGDVAEFTQQAVSTLRNQRFNRTGYPYYKVGRLVRYKPTEIQEILEKSRVSFGER